MSSLAEKTGPCLVVISAPSGAGKTTLCKKLLAELPELRLSISATTRAPRGTEQDGVDYYFLTPDLFREAIDQGEFAEWAIVHSHYYGTTRKSIDTAFAQGLSLLLDIDVQGAASLRTAYPAQCLSIFIAPPSLEELEQRLRKRNTDTDEVITRRMANARIEMDQAQHFNVTLVNDDLNSTYQSLRSLVANRIRTR